MTRSLPTCPICKMPVTNDDKPFCSQRCRNIDLNRWLGETYTIPAEDQTPPDNALNDNDQST